VSSVCFCDDDRCPTSCSRFSIATTVQLTAQRACYHQQGRITTSHASSTASAAACSRPHHCLNISASAAKFLAEQSCIIIILIIELRLKAILGNLGCFCLKMPKNEKCQFMLWEGCSCPKNNTNSIYIIYIIYITTCCGRICNLH
jgi:hypothetical protein